MQSKTEFKAAKSNTFINKYNVKIIATMLIFTNYIFVTNILQLLNNSFKYRVSCRSTYCTQDLFLIYEFPELNAMNRSLSFHKSKPFTRNEFLLSKSHQSKKQFECNWCVLDVCVSKNSFCMFLFFLRIKLQTSVCPISASFWWWLAERFLWTNNELLAL